MSSGHVFTIPKRSQSQNCQVHTSSWVAICSKSPWHYQNPSNTLSEANISRSCEKRWLEDYFALEIVPLLLPFVFPGLLGFGQVMQGKCNTEWFLGFTKFEAELKLGWDGTTRIVITTTTITTATATTATTTATTARRRRRR